MWLDRFFLKEYVTVDKTQSRTALEAVKHYEKNIVILNRNFDKYADILTDWRSARNMYRVFDDDNIKCDDSTCQLCREYVHCCNCPVSKAGNSHCNSTPWNDVSNLVYSERKIESIDDAVKYLNEILDAFGREIVFLLSFV